MVGQGHIPRALARRSRRLGRPARVCLLVSGLAIAAAAPALAQGWTWPWGGSPTPREPVYRQPPPPQAPPGQSYGGYVPGQRPPICAALEQRLAQEANRGSQSRDQLPRITDEMRQADRQFQFGQAQLERLDCFDYFFFAKSLKRTRQCIDLNSQVEGARRRLADLEAQRQQIMGTGNRSYQDDLIGELARNNCGASYQQEASRRNPFSSIWQDGEDSGGYGGRFGSLPFATYRTICVRLCDGYYFPVSFSTLPEHFDKDAQVCKSQCAAPADLYYHQNPGGAVEQAMSHYTKQPYSSLKSAFRYRKEFVQGCSCKQAEYVPAPAGIEKRAEAVAPAPAAPPKR